MKDTTQQAIDNAQRKINRIIHDYQSAKDVATRERLWDEMMAVNHIITVMRKVDQPISVFRPSKALEVAVKLQFEKRAETDVQEATDARRKEFDLGCG